MTVIGVAPASFHGIDVGETPALWIPAMMKRQATPEWDRLLDRRAVWMHVFGRLKPGVTAEQARAGLQPWFKAMLEADTRREGFPRVTPDAAPRVPRFDARRAARGAQGWSDLRGTLDAAALGADGRDAAPAAAGVAQRREPVPRARRGADAAS